MEQRRHCDSSIKTLKGWSTSENKYFKKRKGFIIPTLAHLANTQVGLLQRCLNYLGASVILAMHFTGFLSDWHMQNQLFLSWELTLGTQPPCHEETLGLCVCFHDWRRHKQSWVLTGSSCMSEAPWMSGSVWKKTGLSMFLGQESICIGCLVTKSCLTFLQRRRL